MQNYSTLPDDELVKLLNEDDAGAFTEIYNRHWEKLLAIGYYHTKEKGTAEDIVHDVMLSLWSRRKELEIQSLNAYLGTAIKFAVFKTISRAKRVQVLESETHLEDKTHIEEKLEAKFMEEYLRGAVEQLPEKTRIIFQYSRNVNFPVQLIAHKLNLSPKAVEYHMSKALRVLREKLQKIKFIFF